MSLSLSLLRKDKYQKKKLWFWCDVSYRGTKEETEREQLTRSTDIATGSGVSQVSLGLSKLNPVDKDSEDPDDDDESDDGDEHDDSEGSDSGDDSAAEEPRKGPKSKPSRGNRKAKDKRKRKRESSEEVPDEATLTLHVYIYHILVLLWLVVTQ